MRIILLGQTGKLGSLVKSKLVEANHDLYLFESDYENLPDADILINCIGDVNLKSFLLTTEEDFDSLVWVNIRIPFLAYKDFALGGGKHIISIGSTRSFTPAPNKALYSSTKAALRSLTHSINIETETKATLICPGTFEDEETLRETVNAIMFSIENPNVKEIIIGGQF